MNSVQPKNRAEWRQWLIQHHAVEKEVWLIYFKKSTNKPTITYNESVEEAVCFGWIDGIKKKVDEERYTHRFTLRKEKSNWSETNIERAFKMIREKKMTKMGLTFFNKRKEYEAELNVSNKEKSLVLNADLEKGLKANTKAWSNFNRLSPGHKKMYILWLNNAKKEETKRKRLAKVIQFLESNQKSSISLW